MLHCVFISYNPLEISLLSVFHQSEVFRRVEDDLMQSRSKASVKLDVYPCFVKMHLDRCKASEKDILRN